MEAVACRDCDAGDAVTAYCADCKAYYCTVCAASHCRQRTTREHAIAPICGMLTMLPMMGGEKKCAKNVNCLANDATCVHAGGGSLQDGDENG